MNTFKQDLYSLFNKRNEYRTNDYPNEMLNKVLTKAEKSMDREDFIKFEDLFAELIGDFQDMYYKKGFVDGISFQEEVQNMKIDLANAGEQLSKVQ
ncbi:hypothetical protein [Pseudalkalibacillus decolorationis]|uniref:hypothetical protein n=1 Tax=Pseudalkalibacillus decolorationis TaxID=163879 RepID=UPI002147D8CF|nr:hypothetical protein [Pseudalkalibacillus decolorationis]